MKKYSLLLVALLVVCVGCAPSVQKTAEPSALQNVIVMFGDGMGVGQIEISRLFEYGKEENLFLQSLPHVALVQTYSANNFVTDSAAAGTALATGYKTDNKMVGVTSDGTPVDSIIDWCRKDGKKTGIISTNTVYDATPASYSVSAESRYSSAKMALQLLDSNIDVILGGGAKYFGPKKQEGVDLVEKFKEKGYAFAADKDELMAVEGSEKLLGLFHSSYMNYQQDKEEYESKEPSLYEMTAKAIELLSQSEKGFFLMSEGARIDHASHAADFPGVWKEMIDFDAAVKHAVEWAEQDGNTLVLVLADHETMSFGAAEAMDIEALKQIQVSPEYMAVKMEKAESGTAFIPSSVKAIFNEYANIELTDEEVAAFNDRIVDKEENKMYYEYKIGWEVGSIIAEKYHAAVMSTGSRKLSDTGGHTGNMVPLFAYGVGAERFEGVLDNTDVPKILRELLGY